MGTVRSSQRACRFCLSLAILALLTASSVWANTITVTNTNDSGPGSLRAAIASASSGDTINFSVTGAITLGSTLTIGTNLTISGPGDTSLAISGNRAVRVFYINGGSTVSISGVTIEKGGPAMIQGPDGAGIFNGGTLTLSRIALRNNLSMSSNGGGIYNSGTVTVTDSTISGNEAYIGSGGGVYNNGGTLRVTNSTIFSNYTYFGGVGSGICNEGGKVTVTNSTISGNGAARGGGGGISNGGTLTVTNSTLSGNWASFGAGGISNGGTLALTNSTLSGNWAGYWGGGIINSASATVSNSTLSGNSAYIGGGIYNVNGTLTVKNSIVANSTDYVGASTGGNCVSSGTVSSMGDNLSDDASCSFAGTGDRNSTSAGLDPKGLQDNGGPTQTIALLATSPAVDAIPIGACTDVNGNAVTTDQRGVALPQGPACDIGAFEFVPYTAAIQPPISADGSSVFNSNRGVVPVKFTAALNGTPTCQLPPATISLTRTVGGTVGPINENIFSQPSDSGSNFRNAGCQYIYNLATGSLGPGAYRVQINISNVPVGSATLILR